MTESTGPAQRPAVGGVMVAVAADPYHRAAVAYGRDLSALIADRFVENVLMLVSPDAEFTKRSDLEWLVWLDADDPNYDAFVTAGLPRFGAHIVEVDGQQCFLDVAMGVSVAADMPAGSSFDDVIQAADAALFTALFHHNPVVVANGEMAGRVRADIEMANALIDCGESSFVSHYQAIVSLPEGKIVGYESLLRWNTASGIKKPEAFMSVAEATSLIVPMGRNAIAGALAVLADDITRIAGAAGIVSINLSRQQLWDGNLVAHVAGLLEKHDLAPDRVWFEISETEAVRLGGTASRTVHALNDLGCTICIDDLGSGFSALRYVRDLPVDVVKVDRTLIDPVVGSATDRAVVRAICDMARATGVKTLAEGVETYDVLAAVTELGFDYAQGYLIGLPGDPADVFGPDPS